MVVFAVWKDWENITVLDALLIALIAIIIVFLVLTIIILVSYLFQRGINEVERKTHILPREENMILEEDEELWQLLLLQLTFIKKQAKKPILSQYKESRTNR